MPDHNRCASCPSNRPAVLARNDDHAPIAIVLEHPSEAEATKREWFAGKRGGAGMLLRDTIKELGYDVDELYVCSALNCRPTETKQAMLKKAMLSCRERLVDELNEAGIEKVLCVGSIAYSALLSLPRNVGITKVRGRWRQAFGMNVLGTLPPGFVIGTPDYFRDFAFDLEKFFTTDGPEPNPVVNVTWPETIGEMREAFEYLHAQAFVSWDLETTGFSPISDTIIAAGFGTLPDSSDHGEVIIIDDKLLESKTTWREFARLLNSDQEVAFHNAKFDLQFLKEHLTQRGQRYAPRNVHDTMLLNYTLDERPIGRFEAHNLEGLARRHFDAPDYGINMGEFLTQWHDTPANERGDLRRQLRTYLALDCYYTSRLFPQLWNAAMLEDDEREDKDQWGLLDLYETLLIPGTLALADIEHKGILIDREMYAQSRDTLDRKAKNLLKKIQRITGIKDFNPGSPKQVKEYIYDELGFTLGLVDADGNVRTDEHGKTMFTPRRGKLREGATAAAVLRTLAYRQKEKIPPARIILDGKKVDIIEAICEYRNLTKNIGTYVNGLANRVDTDGRLRTSFNLNGTATGRLSSSGPNLQNIPDASHTGVEIRSGFIAPPDHVFVYADFKQLEVRIAAWLSDDDTMREIFVSGRDPHQEIAWSIYHKPREEVTHYMRWLAKNILFGLLYGRGYESVASGPEQEDIAARGGRRWDVDEVKGFFDSLLAEWDKFAQWQKDQKYRGYREGEITMPTGRKRRFGFIPKHDGGYVGRASFNNPIQGTASDFMLAAMIKLHDRLPAGAEIVLTVHDSLMVECREELAGEVVEMMRTIMEEEPLFEIGVPLKIDLEVYRRWGESDVAKAESLVTDLTDDPDIPPQRGGGRQSRGNRRKDFVT